LTSNVNSSKSESNPGNLKELADYFREKAADYDAVDNQAYWRLSDKLLRALLVESLFPELPSTAAVLDAGAGTGRWSEFVAHLRPSARITLVDYSHDMLAIAKQKSLGVGATFIVGDLHNLDGLVGNESFDAAICFHNVLAFCENPQLVLERITQTLKPDGLLALMTPNQYHAVHFNLTSGRIEEAAKIANAGIGTFVPGMPPLWTWTPNGLLRDIEEAGLEVVSISGFPALIYPGYAETQLFGQTDRLVDVLDDTEQFDRIFEIERKLLGRQDVAARGNNLVVIAKRRTRD
jgi:SAM-dependent methyltransferase